MNDGKLTNQLITNFNFFYLNIKRQNLIIRSQKTCIFQFLDSEFFFTDP